VRNKPQELFHLVKAFHAVAVFPAMRVGVRAAKDCVDELVFLDREFGEVPPASALAERALRQLERYRDDPEYRFQLPLAEAGSPFQRRVWAAIATVSAGRTATYGALAKALGSVPRAVGQACGANPFPLVIPCHRIVAAGGLGGFAHQREGFHLGV
jgi:methylated-DNA-[protein]-cysteine S-methyltransferase